MLISVVTITYNSRDCIEKTIRSVLSQEGAEFEYLIIDGGSRDGTVDIIASFAARDPRIRWISEPDRGISDAFNKGIRLSSGEVIGIINADDEYAPGALQAVARAHREHPEADVLHGDMLRLQGDTPLFTIKPLPVHYHIWRQMPVNHPATFVTRRAYDKAGLFDADLRLAMDYDLMLRLYRAGCPFLYLERTLALMRYGGASDDRFLDGLREFREITVRQGYPRWKGDLWFVWKAAKGYAKIALRRSGLQGLLALHPRFRGERPAAGTSVLFLVDKSGFGGVQTIAYSLIERGVPDVRLHFFFLRNINDRFQMEDLARPDVRYARATGRYSLSPFLDLLGMVRKNRVDILHLNGNKSVIFGVLTKMLFKPRLKLVAHDHGGVFDNTSWYVSFLKHSQRWVDTYVTVSQHRKSLLVSRSAIDPLKVRVINNFVDPARLGVDGPAQPPAPRRQDGFVVGYVGGLSRIKGCDVLIKAAAILKDTIPELRLLVAGDGPARGELEAQARELGVMERITFLGFVDKPGAVYASFDLMVIPSRSEEGPICLYEAWLMGLPVVASDAKVLDERIRDGETGIFFRSEDSEDLARKIALVYNNRALAEKIRSGGAREALCHTVDQYRSNLRDLYLSLGGAPGAAPPQ